MQNKVCSVRSPSAGSLLKFAAISNHNVTRDRDRQAFVLLTGSASMYRTFNARKSRYFRVSQKKKRDPRRGLDGIRLQMYLMLQILDVRFQDGGNPLNS